MDAECSHITLCGKRKAFHSLLQNYKVYCVCILWEIWKIASYTVYSSKYLAITFFSLIGPPDKKSRPPSRRTWLTESAATLRPSQVRSDSRWGSKRADRSETLDRGIYHLCHGPMFDAQQGGQSDTVDTDWQTVKWLVLNNAKLNEATERSCRRCNASGRHPVCMQCIQLVWIGFNGGRPRAKPGMFVKLGRGTERGGKSSTMFMYFHTIQTGRCVHSSAFSHVDLNHEKRFGHLKKIYR